MEALRTVLETDNLTLVFHDGSNSIINDTVRVVSYNLPTEWGQYHVNYEVVFEYKVLKPTYTISLTTTLGGVALSPHPSLGREYENQAAVMRCKVTLSGFFDEGTIALNQAQVDAIRDLVDNAGVTALVYDGVTENVRNITISAPTAWAEDILPYTITCEFDTLRTGVVTSASLGGYTFTIEPSFGRRHSRDGHYQTITVTLSGVFDEGTVALNQAELESLRDVANTSSATLVYGSFSQTVRNMQVEAPAEWTEIFLPFTVTAEYVTTRSTEVTEACTLCGFTFPQLPSFGRKVAWKRKSAQISPSLMTIQVVLSGKFSGSGINANITLIDSLLAACDTGSGVLAYGSQFSETVRVLSIDAPTEWTEDFLPFTITCEYDAPVGGTFAGNIIDFETKQQVSEVYQRTAFHEIPYANGRITQSLGLSHFTVAFTGFFVGATLADALTAYRAEVATRAAGGILMPGATRTEDDDANRVDYNATYSYNVAATVAAQTSIR